MSENERNEQVLSDAAAVEVTEAMLEAGFRVLVESGMKPADEYLRADRLLVEEISTRHVCTSPASIRATSAWFCNVRNMMQRRERNGCHLPRTLLDQRR